MLNHEQQSNLNKRGYTRRDVGRIATLLTAGAALPFFNEAAMAQLSSLGRKRLPPTAVKINSNESPWGPSPAAIEAIRKVALNGNRYQGNETRSMLEAAAKAEGLTVDNYLAYPGSSLALHHGVIGFVSPTRGMVTADPGYEAAARAAEYIGAKVVRVPLAKDATHDVQAMLAANPNAGLYYICNPNNPTGTPTPRSAVNWLISNKPAGSIVLLDEAYIHFTDEPFGSDLVKAGKDVVVLRTFSKIYAMAGLRAGLVIGRPDLLAKMSGWSSGAMPVTGMAAARASLLDTEFVATRKKMVADIREDTFAFFKRNNFPYAPSMSNKFMVDTGRPAQEVISAMAEREVYIGRSWSAWPTHVRVSVGTAEEMEKFKKAFLAVLRG